MSVDLSMTTTAAVPSPDLTATREVEIHENRVGDVLRQNRHRRAAGDHRHEIVPAAPHAAGVALDELLQRNAHCLFDIARLVHVARDAENFGARVVGPAEPGEPVRAAAQDGRYDGNRLDIIDGRGTAIDTDIGGKRGLQPGLTLLALEAFQKRGFLAADIGAGAMVNVAVEVPAVNVVLADKPGFVSLVDGGLQALAFADEFAADIDVANVGAHREGCDQAAFDQKMRIVPHDVAVFARAGLGFVRIDDEIVRPLLHLFGHE